MDAEGFSPGFHTHISGPKGHGVKNVDVAGILSASALMIY